MIAMYDKKWLLYNGSIIVIIELGMLWLAVYYHKKNAAVSWFAIFGLVVVNLVLFLTIRDWA